MIVSNFSDTTEATAWETSQRVPECSDGSEKTATTSCGQRKKLCKTAASHEKGLILRLYGCEITTLTDQSHSSLLVWQNANMSAQMYLSLLLKAVPTLRLSRTHVQITFKGQPNMLPYQVTAALVWYGSFSIHSFNALAENLALQIKWFR